MKKTELKVGSRLKLRGPVGYVRVDDHLIQRPNPGCNGVRNNAYHGTIRTGDTTYVVTGIVGREFEMKTEDGSEIRQGLDTITMRWCHQLDWAPALAPVATEPTIEILSIKREVETDPESIDGMLAELESLQSQMQQLETVKIRYDQVQSRIVDTLSTRLTGVTLQV